MGICLYKSNGNTLETTLFSDGIGLMFDAGGRFVKAVNVLPDYSFRSVDMISVLQYSGGTEVAYSINGGFEKIKTTKSANDIMQLLNSGAVQNNMFLGIRNLNVNGVLGCQYIYVYRPHYLKAITLKSILT